MNREELCNRLGIPLVNDKSELKAHWRKLILKYHPDRNKAPNAEKSFILIQKLFEELTKTFDVIPQDLGFTIIVNGFNFSPTTSATDTSYTWSY